MPRYKERYMPKGMKMKIKNPGCPKGLKQARPYVVPSKGVKRATPYIDLRGETFIRGYGGAGWSAPHVRQKYPKDLLEG